MRLQQSRDKQIAKVSLVSYGDNCYPPNTLLIVPFGDWERLGAQNNQ